MNVLIFKTDINCPVALRKVAPIFGHMTTVHDWNVDLHDVDYVLRIEADDDLLENDVISALRIQGIQCETLPD